MSPTLISATVPAGAATVVVVHRGPRQLALAMSQELVNFTRARRVELERAVGRVGRHRHRGLLRCIQRRVGGLRQRLEHREVGQRGDQAAGQDDRLAADPVGQRAEEQEAAGAEDQRPGHEDVGREAVDLDHVLQEEQRVELARVPDHGLAGGEAEQGDQRDLAVLPVAEGFAQRRLGRGALLLHLLEGRDSFICRRM